MKLMPAASARSSTACVVDSSIPTLCMNDFSSASPNVIAPRHKLDTFAPAAPRLRYCMTCNLLLTESRPSLLETFSILAVSDDCDSRRGGPGERVATRLLQRAHPAFLGSARARDRRHR